MRPSGFPTVRGSFNISSRTVWRPSSRVPLLFQVESGDVRDNAAGNLISALPSVEAAASERDQVSQDDLRSHLGRQTSYPTHTLDEVTEMENMIKNVATTPRKAKRVFNMLVSIQDSTSVGLDGRVIRLQVTGVICQKYFLVATTATSLRDHARNGKLLFLPIFISLDQSTLSVRLTNALLLLIGGVQIQRSA